MIFSVDETAACRRLVEMAFEEDLGPMHEPYREHIGDITTKALIPAELPGRAVFVARMAGVIAGLPAVEIALQTSHTPLLKFEPFIVDGTQVKPGDRIAAVSGLMEFILTAERTALNFLQHLSGVATLTRRFVDATDGLPCNIYDTRKTLPGWRLLQKYAVRCGGGHNHRMGLFDAILIKDNHLAVIPDLPEGLPEMIRSQINIPIEIEIENLAGLDRVMRWRPDIVLLDNMNKDDMREAVRRRNDQAPTVQLEASGGVTLDTVRAIAETGVDRISIGALTHSAPALDIALDYEAP
jgi:nicotinate-nucleotide pyrophosphorylase (carboxylating)